MRRLRLTVGMDAEAASQVALDWAIGVARRTPVALRLVTAFDMLMVDPIAERDALAAATRRARAEAPDTLIESAVAEGSIPEILARFSADADLLVLGSHRTRRWQSILAGDVPAHLAATMNLPVVVVPDDAMLGRGRVVVGVDDDASSEGALAWAADLARRLRTELEVMHAWTRPDASDPDALAGPPARMLQREHREHLAAAAESVRARVPHLRVREVLVEGSALTGLLGMRRAELVVVGSHRRGPLAGLVQGSLARDLLRESRLPVCVAPAASESDVPVRHRVATVGA